MPATVPVRRLSPALAERDGVLRESGQGVVLAEDADDRPAGTDARRERGRNVSNASFHLKAGFFERVSE